MPSGATSPELTPSPEATALVTASATTEPSVAASAVIEEVSGDRHFVSPSGNIRCLVSDTIAGCDIAKRDWQMPPAPKSCSEQNGQPDWGLPLLLRSEGPGTFYCGTDVPLATNDVPPPLAYDHGIRSGDFECVSRANAVTCRNIRTAHGFTVSRAAYRLY